MPVVISCELIENFKYSYSTEPYLKIITSKKYRSTYAKFRCEVAPLKIETCRYGLNRIPVEERVLPSCRTQISCYVGLPTF